MTEVNYYRSPAWYWWPLAFLVISLTTIGVFCPDVIPYSRLSLVGSALSYLNYTLWPVVYGWFAFLVLAHIGEAACAFILARKMNLNSSSTLLWMGQTFLLGWPSFSLLLAKYRRVKKEH